MFTSIVAAVSGLRDITVRSCTNPPPFSRRFDERTELLALPENPGIARAHIGDREETPVLSR